MRRCGSLRSHRWPRSGRPYEDAYHVLHLSAHGSPESWNSKTKTAPGHGDAGELMQALKTAPAPVPLIILSSCSGGATGTAAMAAGLIARGADRVVAMLASVTDTYATRLARHFYSELSAHPALAVGRALAQARYLNRRQKAKERRSPATRTRIRNRHAAGG